MRKESRGFGGRRTGEGSGPIGRAISEELLAEAKGKRLTSKLVPHQLGFMQIQEPMHDSSRGEEQ